MSARALLLPAVLGEREAPLKVPREGAAGDGESWKSQPAEARAPAQEGLQSAPRGARKVTGGASCAGRRADNERRRYDRFVAVAQRSIARRETPPSGPREELPTLAPDGSPPVSELNLLHSTRSRQSTPIQITSSSPLKWRSPVTTFAPSFLPAARTTPSTRPGAETFIPLALSSNSK